MFPDPLYFGRGSRKKKKKMSLQDAWPHDAGHAAQVPAQKESV